MNEIVYAIWLSLRCTPGSTTFNRLLGSFDSAYEVYNAEEREIRRCVGSKSSDCSSLLDKELDKAQEIYDFCTSKGVGLLTYWDEQFPYQLKEIKTPPVLLYYRGKRPSFDKGFRCAIVGTRSLSVQGRANAFKLGYDMSCAGATIVSGMAMGIDGVAMAGALAAGGSTIAVLGSGIDVCYPAGHLKLAREIVKNGCVFTEYAPGTKPDKHNFPRRNRIISGLCSCTVVVEGKETSGSIITARYAKEQERTVFAFPGNVNDENSQVGNVLLKNGAQVCTAADDIVRFYEKEVPAVLNPHNLKLKMPVDMMSYLRSLEVLATAKGDDIFIPASAPKRAKRNDEYAQVSVPPALSRNDSVSSAKPAVVSTDNLFSNNSSIFTFDKESLKIYKRIPADGDCTIEELIDEHNDLRSVTRILLKLEMGKFIVRLPGERIKRNLK